MKISHIFVNNKLTNVNSIIQTRIHKNINKFTVDYLSKRSDRFCGSWVLII